MFPLPLFPPFLILSLLDNGKLRPIDGTCKKSCTLASEDENEALCGETGITTATIVFSSVVAVCGLCLIVYHIVYVTYLLPKKKEEEQGYEKLLN